MTQQVECMECTQAGTNSDLVYNADVPVPIASILCNKYSSHTKKGRTSERGQVLWQGKFLYPPM